MMNRLRKNALAVGAVGVLGFSGVAQALPFSIAGPGASNVDTNPATVVSLSTILSGTIADLNISINIGDLNGPHSEDFDVSLQHVDTGTTVSLYIGTHLPPHAGDFNVTLDDESAGPVISTGAAGGFDLTGNFKPVELLAAFDGESLAGQWNLIILDDFIPNEGNILVSWTLSGETVPEPGTVLLLGLGLVVLRLATRTRP